MTNKPRTGLRMLRPTFIIIVLSLFTLLLQSPLHTGSFSLNIPQPRILLLTAHPDDECLFFGPTILALTQQNAEVYSLSLSTGNADGLGTIRQREFHQSFEILGVPSERRWVIDHPDLQDNITSMWEPKIISEAVLSYVTSYGIDTILTFDYAGVSSHPNHISISYGAAKLLHTLNVLDKPIPRLYTLTTVPTFIKYTSILGPLVSKFDLLLPHSLIYMRTLLGTGTTLNTATESGRAPVFVSGASDYLRTLTAMRAHQSQLVWFRWLYVVFSRYMWVNEWAEVRLQ